MELILGIRCLNVHVISAAQSKQWKQKMDFDDVVNQRGIVGAVEQPPWSMKSDVTQGEMFTDEVMCSSLTSNRITDFLWVSKRSG